ncbi:MAG TPA: DNA polymerase III subunit chi [Leucothrix mucor]|nr:DNA polymerase III subunit chi [Leucothrix mucor]
MTEISFYVGKNNTLRGRLLLACRLVEKARQRNMHVHIHTDGFSTTKQMDELLWTWNETSFIPHTNRITETTEETVTIANDYEPINNCDYLINLSNQRPNFFSRYKKMAEIIDQTETILTAGRERYSFYKNRGYTLKYYQL